jgi:uncharacterized RDD family membrane protein YckC
VQWTDEVRIETPEQIDVSLEVVGLVSRFLARSVDWLFKSLLVSALLVPALILFALVGVAFEDKAGHVSMLLVALLVGVGFAMMLGYDVYAEVRHNGQTPGKMLTGIRVVRDSGAPVDFRTACVRNLLCAADFLPVFYFLGSLLVLLSSRNQRLGDLAAGTLVIRERASAPPGDVGKLVARLASPDVAFTADQLAACAPSSLGILRSFFQRYAQFDPGPRRRLAGTLVSVFSENMESPPVMPLGVNQAAAVFLASLYRDLEAFRQHGG